LNKFERISKNRVSSPRHGGVRYSSAAPPPAALPKKSARTFRWKRNKEKRKNF